MAPVTRGLRRAGILVRHFATPLLQDALRISIGTPAEMDALFKALAPLVRRDSTEIETRASAPERLNSMAAIKRLFGNFRSSRAKKSDSECAFMRLNGLSPGSGIPARNTRARATTPAS